MEKFGRVVTGIFALIGFGVFCEKAGEVAANILMEYNSTKPVVKENSGSHEIRID